MLELNAKTTALVVIDLQEGILPFAGGPHTADEVVNRAGKLAAKFRASGQPVFLVRVGWSADYEWLMAADLIVASPGIALAHPSLSAAADAGIEIVGDIELFCREAQAPIVAITGSNGKSTVTTLVGEMVPSPGDAPSDAHRSGGLSHHTRNTPPPGALR